MTTKHKRPWSKPTLMPHRIGAMNKFGAIAGVRHMPSFAGASIPELVERFGSPLFVISEARLRENARRLRRAFETRYPSVVYAWSYKTNYLGAVCQTLHQEGAWAEVVSAFEYEKARALGVPAERILFNGPGKKRPILERALAEGAHIHVDHWDELLLVEAIAREQGRKAEITIRINFDTGFTEPWSRFGFNLEHGQAMDAARMIARSPHLELVGLHSHLGTFITDVRAYAAQARIMCAFMEEVEAETGAHIRRLDIGGGFASRNALQGVYLPPEQVTPSFDQYAEAITDALHAALRAREQAGKAKPTLVLETGRAVVDDAEILIASVLANKRLPDGRRALVLDAGVNLLFTAFWYNHPVHPVRPVDGVPEETVLYGPLCMNIDVVRASVQLPPLETGELLVFEQVGAYDNTQWMQFIEYRPRVVMVHEDGEVSVIREAETLATITELERIPEHLQRVAWEA